MYKKSCEMIYKMISKRIRHKRTVLGKNNDDILPGESNLMSAIANNTKHPKKNKYLIPASRKNDLAEDRDYIFQITNNLEFGEKKYLLWGNPKEIRAYSNQLFLYIIDDAIKCEDEKTVRKITEVLQDYIPYAMDKYNQDMADRNETMLDLFLSEGLYEDKYFLRQSETEAVCRLCQQVSGLFYDLLMDFLYERNDTIKLDRAFSVFVKKNVLPMIRGSVPAFSIGKMAGEILSRCMELQDTLCEQEVSYWEEGDDKVKPMIITNSMVNDLIRANWEYIEKLSVIQSSHEEKIDLEFLKSTWYPEMCMPGQETVRK